MEQKTVLLRPLTSRPLLQSADCASDKERNNGDRENCGILLRQHSVDLQSATIFSSERIPLGQRNFAIEIERGGISLGALLKILIAASVLAVRGQENGKRRTLGFEERASRDDDLVFRLQVKSVGSRRNLKESRVCYRLTKLIDLLLDDARRTQTVGLAETD